MRIKDRIRKALSNGRISRNRLMMAVFPQDQYPKAWNYQANGGPPGCTMALGKALREMRSAGELWEVNGEVGPAKLLRADG